MSPRLNGGWKGLAEQLRGDVLCWLSADLTPQCLISHVVTNKLSTPAIYERNTDGSAAAWSDYEIVGGSRLD